MKTRVRTHIPILVAGVLLIAGTARAQEVFNLAAPGARANAMGGAFIGVADDASASVTNPAGLSHLAVAEVYGEIKSREGFAGRDIFPSFVSLALPLTPRITVAAIRHQFAYISFSGDNGKFSGATYGASVAARISNTLRVGVTAGLDHELDDFGGGDAETFNASKVIVGGLWSPRENFSIGVSGAKVAGGVSQVFDPSRIGVGLKLAATPRLLIAADVAHTLSESDLPGFILKVTQFHAGGEFLVLGTTDRKIFVRGGVCACPSPIEDPFFEQNTGGTFGFGYATRQRAQVDFAFSTQQKEITLSAAVRF